MLLSERAEAQHVDEKNTTRLCSLTLDEFLFKLSI